jgi:hypothetical protein
MVGHRLLGVVLYLFASELILRDAHDCQVLNLGNASEQEDRVGWGSKHPQLLEFIQSTISVCAEPFIVSITD